MVLCYIHIIQMTVPEAKGRKTKQPVSDTLEPHSAPSKKIVHPIFSDCAQFTLDPYWQQVFEECARGKFPRGSGIDSEGKVIYFRNKATANNANNNRNYVSYRLKKNPEQIFKDLKMLFQNELKFKSNQDRKDIRAELDDICKDLQESYAGTWQQIKRKKIKDPIIRRYILDLKETYNLTDRETADVAQLIRLGFSFNWISNEEVVYEDHHILNIHTLQFDPDERIFELEEPDTLYKREYKPKILKLSNLWGKHLEHPKNRYAL